jgi:hypothetical protein
MSETNNETTQIWRFTHNAMACTWQLIIAGEERDYAENVSYVAWDEVDRLERELSRYIAASDVSQVKTSQSAAWNCWKSTPKTCRWRGIVPAPAST